MKKELIVIAKVKVKEDQIDFIKKEATNLIIETRKESGCISYTFHQDNENKNLFFFYEKWNDKKSLENHLNSPHFLTFVKNTESSILDMCINELTVID